MKKKVIVLLLTAILVFSVFPVASYASSGSVVVNGKTMDPIMNNTISVGGGTAKLELHPLYSYPCLTLENVTITSFTKMNDGTYAGISCDYYDGFELKLKGKCSINGANYSGKTTSAIWAKSGVVISADTLNITGVGSAVKCPETSEVSIYAKNGTISVDNGSVIRTDSISLAGNLTIKCSGNEAFYSNCLYVKGNVNLTSCPSNTNGLKSVCAIKVWEYAEFCAGSKTLINMDFNGAPYNDPEGLSCSAVDAGRITNRGDTTIKVNAKVNSKWNVCAVSSKSSIENMEDAQLSANVALNGAHAPSYAIKTASYSEYKAKSIDAIITGATKNDSAFLISSGTKCQVNELYASTDCSEATALLVPAKQYFVGQSDKKLNMFTPEDGFYKKYGESFTICDKSGSYAPVVVLSVNDSAFRDIGNCIPDFKTAILWAVDNEITNGTGPVSFSPNKTCTRGQVVTFLWRAAGCPKPNNRNSVFSDVKEGAYYYDAVLWATENNITNGTSANKFSPDALVTRGQVVTFIYRSENAPNVSGDILFKDVATSDYYYDAVVWAVQKNITNGTDKTHFSPNAICTRAQIVTFIYRDKT